MKVILQLKLMVGLIVIAQTVSASGICEDAGLEGSLYGLCSAYTTDGNSCLDQGNTDSMSCAAIKRNFFKISGGIDLDVLLSGGTGGEIIGTEGGTVALQGVAAVNFPSDAFIDDTPVSITTSAALDVDEAFTEFASIFRPLDRLGYEVRIITGNAPPLSEFVQVDQS